jgi:sortase (surface protein transpeptidase)
VAVTAFPARPAVHPSPVTPPAAAVPVPVRPVTRTPSASSRPAAAPSTAPRHDEVLSRPVRLRVPAIGVDSSLQPLHRLADGSLQSPSRWQRAGYYADGVLPGQTGPAVIAGHIDSTAGPAVFYRLRDLRPGDSAGIVLADGRVLHFVVDRLIAYPKRNFPTEDVYGPTPLPELRLITCTGDFDPRAHSYLDNLVVYAHLTSG